MESSCSHVREAMNLVHVCRISRRKPNCKQVPYAVSTHLGHRKEEGEEEEEGLFKADAVNEEDPERDRRRRIRRRRKRRRRKRGRRKRRRRRRGGVHMQDLSCCTQS